MNATIRAAMDAVNANVLTESSLMLRTCEHSVRHPVGHLDPQVWSSLTHQSKESRKQLHAKHERVFGAGYIRADCCGCCPHRGDEASV